MIIRKAKKEDIEEIHKLDKESVKYHRKFDKDFFTISEKWWKIKKDSQLKAISSRKDIVLVAFDDKVVGYIWGYFEREVGKLQELIVISRCRGKGLGKKLISEALKLLKKKCAVVNIEVYVDNEPTVKVYEKLGFKKKEYKMQLRFRNYKPFS